jgi:hypothetical protein
MKKLSIYTFIVIVLLLMAVSCQAETAGQAMTTKATPRETPAENAANSEPSASGPRARLKIPSSLPLGGPVNIQFMLANETDNDLFVLNWFTPLEGLCGDIFRVTRDGQRVRYQGPLASRGNPTPEAYTLIEAGDTVQAEVDLSRAYDFSIPGNYTIEFVSPKLSHIAHSETEMAQSVDELGPVQIPSNEVMVTIGA